MAYARDPSAIERLKTLTLLDPSLDPIPTPDLRYNGPESQRVEGTSGTCRL